MLRYQRLLCLVVPPLLAWCHFMFTRVAPLQVPSLMVNCLLYAIPFFEPWSTMKFGWQDCVLYLAPLIALVSSLKGGKEKDCIA